MQSQSNNDQATTTTIIENPEYQLPEESTTTSPANCKAVAIQACPIEPLMCKRINRDIDAIDPRLRSKIAEVCSGDAGWPLTIIGPAGTGKTCAALCMLDRVVGVQDGPTGGRRYITAADLVRKVNSYRRGEQPQAEESFWDHWQRSKIVTVDEIGAREKVSDAHYEILKMAIDLQQDQPAVFLSNLSIATLAEIYDDRIASRLQFGTVIDLEGWPDRRVMQQNATSSLTSESKP